MENVIKLVDAERVYNIFRNSTWGYTYSGYRSKRDDEVLQWIETTGKNLEMFESLLAEDTRDHHEVFDYYWKESKLRASMSDFTSDLDIKELIEKVNSVYADYIASRVATMCMTSSMQTINESYTFYIQQ